jgi:hypothetical protein
MPNILAAAKVVAMFDLLLDYFEDGARWTRGVIRAASSSSASASSGLG